MTSTCPFCNAEIDEGLSRFGGNCPHCFNVIPGEEAATDPGIPAVTPAAEEPDSGSSKTLLVVAFVAVVAIGASVGLMGRGSNAPEPEAAPEVSAEEAQAQIQAEVERIAEEAAAAAKAAEIEAERLAAEEADRIAAERRRQEQARAAAATAETEAPPPASNANESSTPSLTVLPTGPTREVTSAVLSTPSDINRAVRNSLKRYKGQLNQCYDKQLIVDDGLQGTWQVAFTVEENGTTSGVVVTPKAASNADFESCMKRQVSSWTFPRISAPHPYIKEYSFRP
ncbi:MAG: AgmX/PglI C-terminal domain-containing protein [Myxococcota bacterium]|nr:AgmX/PglI C-terminal domain-containing protein [Myxococcota bacterium]